MTCATCQHSNSDNKDLLPYLTCLRPDAPKRGGGYSEGYGVRKDYLCTQYLIKDLQK